MKFLRKYRIIFLAFILIVSGCSSNISAPEIEVYSLVEVIETAAPSATPSITPTAPVAEENQVLLCTISVKCDTVFKNIDSLNPEKAEIIPSGGIIFSEKEVVFSNGDSVFDVLLREMRRNKIHLEFVNAPIYNSTYIEGIGNLYEFDCGELSGWMYKVNGSFPNYGCSKYIINPGDKIEWIYTCDLGKDIGGENISQNQ